MGSQSPGLLTPQQTLILELLSARFGLRGEEIARALYGQKVPRGAMNTISVQLHRIRRALEPYGVEIVTYEHFNASAGRYRYAIPLRCRPALVMFIESQGRRDGCNKAAGPKASASQCEKQKKAS